MNEIAQLANSPNSAAGKALQKTPWIGLLLLALATGFAFVDKPVHVDDIYHLAITDQIVRDPLRPYLENARWIATDSFVATPHPPLLFYLYALAYCFAGWNLIAFHCVNGLFQFALVFGVYRIASRWSPRPFLWTLAISLSPYILPANNLMLDVPVVTCWIWAFELQMRALLDERPRSAWLAGIAAGCGLLIKYHTGIMIVLLMYACWRTRKYRALVFLIPASVMFLGWNAYSYFLYGVPHFVYHLSARNLGTEKDPLAIRIRVLPRGIGSVIALTPLLLLALLRKNVLTWIAMLLLVAASISVGLWDQRCATEVLKSSNVNVTAIFGSHYLIFTANGVLATILFFWAIGRGRKECDSQARLLSELLALWALFGLAFNLFALPKVPFGAIRHMQLFLIPMTLGATLCMDRWMEGSSRRVTFAWLCVLFNCGLGIALAISDQDTAKAYPAIVQKDIRPRTQNGGRVWFSGAKSFRYYAEAAGGMFWEQTESSPNLPARSGDFVVLPYLLNPGLVSTMKAQGKPLVDRWQIESWMPVRTISVNANYYGRGNVISLPWEFALYVASAPGQPMAFQLQAVEEVFIFREP